MTRYILYSPGYGAGWVSWHYGPTEEKKFMLEYKPWIDKLLSDPWYRFTEADEEQFKNDWLAAGLNGEKYPYFGGIGQLKVKEVSGQVHITEYDGYESVRVNYDDVEWL